LTLFQKKSRSLSDRSSAIGCLAEIIAGMKSAITPWTEPLMELFYRALSDPEPEVQSNAAFASGMLVENSEKDLSPQYAALLRVLHPLFLLPDDAPAPRLNARDNACGAVARLIVKNTSAIPLESVLPVFVGALPLKNDQLENKPVFRAIFHLFRTNAQILGPYTEKLLAVFAYVLNPATTDEQISDDTRRELFNLVRLLNTEVPGQVQAAGLGVYL
jgi:importin-4